ncbi:MAG TPA: 2-C-methyl-D-erythritol 4-phosphate cytidylyltransferase, partial [Microbacterium sp.]|nr:2-C-methyl-D-erythritol 4-phosphate cytidylyltransferase [Microbacterium sp.]
MIEPTVAVVIVAAGSGTRLGADTPKAFATLRGIPILEHALDGVLRSSTPAQLVVVAPAAYLAQARAIGERLAPGSVDVVA